MWLGQSPLVKFLPSIVKVGRARIVEKQGSVADNRWIIGALRRFEEALYGGQVAVRAICGAPQEAARGLGLLLPC